MYRLFQSIRKRRNKKRIAWLWLFLFAAELFSHGASEQLSASVELLSSNSQSQSQSISITDADEAKPILVSSSVNSQDQQGTQPVCRDESSHHHVLISESENPVRPAKFISVRLEHYPGGRFFTSLTPPFTPPEVS
jgi:hypothetical protein